MINTSLQSIDLFTCATYQGLFTDSNIFKVVITGGVWSVCMRRCTNHCPALPIIESSDISVVLEKSGGKLAEWRLGATSASPLHTVHFYILLTVINI